MTRTVGSEGEQPITTEPEFVAPTPAERRSTSIGYAFAATGAMLFSGKAIFVKLAYAQNVDPETLLALRMGLSFPCYLAVGFLALWDRRHMLDSLPSGKSLFNAALIGVIGMFVASYADLLGLQYISAQFERLILLTYPLFVVLFGALFFHQRIKLRALAAFGVSYAGLGLIFGENLANPGSNVTLGALLVLGAALAFAMYQLLAKNAIGVIGPKLFTCASMTGATVATFIGFFVGHSASDLLVDGHVLTIAFMLAIGSTVLPSFFMNAALHRISAQANSAIGIVSPIATIVLAALILGESLTVTGMIGSALVLAGVAWFAFEDRR